MDERARDVAQHSAGILLAAGASSRLGRPKQLVRIDGRTLVRRAAEEAIGCGFGPLTVVLGAHAEEIRAELQGLDLRFRENGEWEEGIASSLRAGLRASREHDPALARILIVLCDQPAVDRHLLERIVRRHGEGLESATACSVDGRPQAPAIFEAEHFAAIERLRGDAGAREILRASGAQVACVEFPPAARDIDTEDDLRSG